MQYGACRRRHPPDILAGGAGRVHHAQVRPRGEVGAHRAWYDGAEVAEGALGRPAVHGRRCGSHGRRQRPGEDPQEQRRVLHRGAADGARQTDQQGYRGHTQLDCETQDRNRVSHSS